MEVLIVPSAREVAATAAAIVVRTIAERPSAVLGLATGKTFELVYAELVRRHRDEGLDFGAVTTFNVDELVGVKPTHPASYHHYMRERLLRHVNISPKQVHIPDGMAADIERTCAELELTIKAVGGIDLQLLGIGPDGHIGFNEPTSSLASRTRLKTLAPSTRAGLRPGFESDDQVPRHVITMGVGTILEARRCLVLAHGSGKAAAVAGMIEGPITAMNPASALQMHPRTTAIVDEEAAQLLALADYYREVHRNKPRWQKERDGA